MSIFVLIIIGAYVATFGFTLPAENSHWGTFGDYIGGLVNPLIAFMVFIFVAKTYSLQRDEVSELRHLILKQNFEAYFFMELESYSKYVSLVEYSACLGTEAFTKLSEEVSTFSTYKNIFDSTPSFRQTVKWVKHLLLLINSNNTLTHEDKLNYVNAIGIRSTEEIFTLLSWHAFVIDSELKGLMTGFELFTQANKEQFEIIINHNKASRQRKSCDE
jgi:hypothetical protein